MSLTKVKLEFPVHVSHVKIEDKDHYQVKPLFFDFATVVHRRFEVAISKFQNLIKKQLKGFHLNSDSKDRLNWFLLYPQIDFQLYRFAITVYGRQTLLGDFGIALFDIKEHTFACLPALNSFVFMVKKDKKGKFDIIPQAEKVVQRLLNRYKDMEQDEFDFNNYTSTKKEFITAVKTNIQVTADQFNFEVSDHSFLFDFFGNQGKMEGATEIWNVGTNLSNQASYWLKKAYHRDELVERLRQLLFTKPYKNSPIALVGDEGVGKHAVVYETLYQYSRNKKIKKKREVWQIDPTRIISGMSIVGMWQKRLEAILGFVKNPYEENRGSDVLLFENPVALTSIGKSAQNNMTVSDALKPYLEKREVQTILIATPEEWKIIQEKDRRFTDLFQLIRMDEPDLETAVRMTLENRKSLETIHDCQISINAIQALFDFRRNYLKRKALPGSVIKLMSQLAVKHKGKKIDLPEVRQEFESFSGLTEDMFDAAKPLEKNEVSQFIASELVGQDQAVKTLADVIHTMKAKLSPPNKPLASLLFIGPTGVGKTQAAKVLCKYLTGSEDQLMKFDMNEYIDYTAVQRLIGDAQHPEGQLTGKVRYQPFGVVLLDEIEKADTNVHDLLLQILDDARLTDSQGKTVDFSNIIIIMTSNIGARRAAVQPGFKTEASDESAIYRKAVENHFRPEFINRIDNIVIFDPLSVEHILDIAWLQITELLKRDGFVRRTTILNISTKALEWVARRGYNQRMGGRALKRQIEKDLTALTAEQLIGSYSNSPILFDIYLKNNKLVPKISKLEFVSVLEEGWFPNLPTPEKGKRFYHDLLRHLNRIERQILNMDHAGQGEMLQVIDFRKRSQFFLFKEKVSESKEQITNLSLGFRDNNFGKAPAIPLRLKTNSIWSGNDKIHKENYRDLFFQQEGLAEINEIYHQTTAQFNSIQTEFLNSFLNTAFLKLFARDFLENKKLEWLLRFESCITHVGKKQIEYLCELFVKVLDDLAIEHHYDEEQQLIKIEGYSIQHLLKGEIGIHLFQWPYQNPIPIRLILEKPNAVKKESVNNRVIRVYYSQKTLTDFRTGFANAANITIEEFKLLLYAGIPKSIRKGLVTLGKR